MQMKHLAVAVLAAGLTGLGVGMSADAATSPKIEQEGGIPYMSGGVGVGARHRLAEKAAGFDLKLVLANRKGDYLADVPLAIKDHRGHTALRATSQGPWFYAKLPPGRYDVVLSEPGRGYMYSFDIPKHGQRELVVHLG
jgi:hypothetical protein